MSLVVSKVEKILKNMDIKYDAIHCHDWLTMKAGISLKEKWGIPSSCYYSFNRV